MRRAAGAAFPAASSSRRCRAQCRQCSALLPRRHESRTTGSLPSSHWPFADDSIASPSRTSVVSKHEPRSALFCRNRLLGNTRLWILEDQQRLLSVNSFGSIDIWDYWILIGGVTRLRDINYKAPVGLDSGCLEFEHWSLYAADPDRGCNVLVVVDNKYFFSRFSRNSSSTHGTGTTSCKAWWALWICGAYKNHIVEDVCSNTRASRKPFVCKYLPAKKSTTNNYNSTQAGVMSGETTV